MVVFFKTMYESRFLKIKGRNLSLKSAENYVYYRICDVREGKQAIEKVEFSKNNKKNTNLKKYRMIKK